MQAKNHETQHTSALIEAEDESLKLKILKADLIVVAGLGVTGTAGACNTVLAIQKYLYGEKDKSFTQIAIYLPTDLTTEKGTGQLSNKLFIVFLDKPLGKTKYKKGIIESRNVVGDSHLDRDGMEIATEEKVKKVEELIKKVKADESSH